MADLAGLEGVQPRSEPRLDKARHVRYWTRCLRTFLPYQYTSNDSNRMYLAFFIVAALDLLGSFTTACNETERQDYINWVYRCQHPNGGFRMWPGTDFGEQANDANACWDPANIPATYFALSLLVIMGDDMKRVKRVETLMWLGKMQRDDGSFGETLVSSKIEGGRDPRFAYCATGVRYILRGLSSGPLTIGGIEIQDIKIDGLVRCIHASETFEGGIADAPFHEPHAGYTYTSLGALRFIDRLNSPRSSKHKDIVAPTDPHAVLGWLTSRQTDMLDPEAVLDRESAIITPLSKVQSTVNTTKAETPVHQSPDKSSALSLLGPEIECAGMNGRQNKVADTCYAFWVGGSLQLFEQTSLCDQNALQNYLLEKTQHPVLGGFGKFPGELPDLLHSYLGLAALGLMGCEEVKEVDGGMCLSKSASARLPGLWDAWDRQGSSA